MTAPRDGDSKRPFDVLRRVKSGGLTPEQAARLELMQNSAADKRAAILVVEDNHELRKIIVLILRSLGYENVSEAADGRIALDLLLQREFDLVVLDIELPHVNGFEVLATLKNDPVRRHLPVIVASGLDRLDAVVKCTELGAEDFLPKPVNSVLLGARVAASLERKRLRDLERLRLLELQEEKRLLEAEQEKSERLLLNILPRAIAERLKRGEHTIAERHSEVSVLFADLVDFSTLASHTDPQELVAMLNDLFSRFDRLAGRRGLEKIKTIGDCYLVVGGLPEPSSSHAADVAEMGLEMLDVLGDLNRERGLQLALRIGINTGPVVAGVIGSRKFTYDLWGATVNLADRVQSSGLPDRVNVSASTYERLKDSFRLSERGMVDCKGVGRVRTYLLEGRK
jgi:class 3 adenylate cyclase/CheY-like chemotaxis protein